MPQHSITPQAVPLDAYRRAREHAAAIDRSARARLVASGADRAVYLQGLLTNDVAALTAGRGCYAAYLTPQGRMIADLHAYELGDAMLLTMAAHVRQAVLARFEQFVFSEDVRFDDLTGTFAQVAVVGPASAGIVSRVLAGAAGEALRALPEHGNLRAQLGAGAAIVARVTDTGEPGFEIFVDREALSALMAALGSAGALLLDPATADALRIEAGIPEFGRDMDEETIPLEAGIEERAISFTKGCYVGQEVIVRVLHRGHGRVARRLVGLLLDPGAAAAAGSAITLEGQAIGRLTSVTASPALGRPIALGYVHRDRASPGTMVTVGDAPASVAALPFVPR
ncbi:MAG: aminomethyltransferase family protein [Acidobacteria bacterium]|nr:aminomethyltransferase family protein [Acidobacteriota bacterium]